MESEPTLGVSQTLGSCGGSTSHYLFYRDLIKWLNHSGYIASVFVMRIQFLKLVYVIFMRAEALCLLIWPVHPIAKDTDWRLELAQ